MRGWGQGLRGRVASCGGQGCRFDSCSVWHRRKDVSEKDEEIHFFWWRKQTIHHHIRKLMEQHWYQFWSWSCDGATFNAFCVTFSCCSQVSLSTTPRMCWAGPKELNQEYREQTGRDRLVKKRLTVKWCENIMTSDLTETLNVKLINEIEHFESGKKKFSHYITGSCSDITGVVSALFISASSNKHLWTDESWL